MRESVEGTYQNGRIELAETRQLSDYGIDEAQAADLRARLRTFEEDWNRPDMDGYDAPLPLPTA